MRIYITGDTHRDFDRLYYFCEEKHANVEMVRVIEHE